MLDCIIIGSGPAGLSAALNLKTYKKDFLWFGTKRLSDKLWKAEKVTNYPGFASISGEELYYAFDTHRKSAGLDIIEKTVTTIGAMGDHFMVLADNEFYEAQSLILCMGVMSAKLLEGEERLLGRGLSYCATCDGMLYKEKKIAVICTDKKYEHEVSYLADLASEVVYLPTFKDSEIEKDNVKRIDGTPVALKGEKRVEALVLKNGEEVEIDGVFALRNAIAPSTLMPGLAVENGHILADRECATNMAGCFAAGDCIGRPYQFTKAVGEGNVAAHSCIAYLAAKKNNS